MSKRIKTSNTASEIIANPAEASSRSRITIMVSPGDRDSVAKLIGSYLLKGYTLLDDYCVDCTTPLMRRKGDPTFCVHCRDVLAIKAIDSDSQSQIDVASTQSPRAISRSNVPSNGPSNGTDSGAQSNLSNALKTVISSATSKLPIYSGLLAQSNNLHEALQLNQLIQSTLETIEKAQKLAN